MAQSNAFVCTTCAKPYPLDTNDWRCSCGGLFELETRPPFDVQGIDTAQAGLKRYRRQMSLEPGWELVTLEEGNTPLVEVDWEGQVLHFKLESQNPTGSFKDRGAATLVTSMRGLGMKRVVEDSSGNAGASLAAYAARAGIACEICTPRTASGPKLAQMQAYGAEVIEVKGKREYASLAAWAAAAHGAYYASHVYNPFFLVGTETIAYELWEQLGRSAPTTMIVPVGNGTLLLGAYQGFLRLQEAGLIAGMPHLIAVQTAACAPIYRAYCDGQDASEPVAPAATLASGIAIGIPARSAQIIAAVRATKGTVVSVTEAEIAETSARLARQGFYVEETSAVAVAALSSLGDWLAGPSTGPVVVPLTGHGLKTAASGSS
jgi:threonine synthase